MSDTTRITVDLDRDLVERLLDWGQEHGYWQGESTGEDWSTIVSRLLKRGLDRR